MRKQAQNPTEMAEIQRGENYINWITQRDKEKINRINCIAQREHNKRLKERVLFCGCICHLSLSFVPVPPPAGRRPKTLYNQTKTKHIWFVFFNFS